MTELLDYHYKTAISIRFADINAMGHVDNAVYLTFFEMARSSYWNEIVHWDWDKVGIIIGHAEIDFLKPIQLKEKVFAYVRTSLIGKSSFTMDYAFVKIINGVEELCTTGSTVCITFDYLAKSTTRIPDAYRLKMQEFEALEI